MTAPHVELIPKRQQDLHDGSPDYIIQAGTWSVGRIYCDKHADQRVVWTWSVSGIVTSMEIGTLSGAADTFDGAKAQFREAFDRWLTWAMALPADHLSMDTINKQLKRIGVR